MAIGEIHKNDIGTAFRATIKDETDTVVDISSATTLQMLFLKPDNSLLTKTASLVNTGTDGKMQYVSASGDLDTCGWWRSQGFVRIGSAEWYSDILRFQVHDNLR